MEERRDHIANSSTTVYDGLAINTGLVHERTAMKPIDDYRDEAIDALVKAQYALLFAFEMREKAGEHAKLMA